LSNIDLNVNKISGTVEIYRENCLAVVLVQKSIIYTLHLLELFQLCADNESYVISTCIWLYSKILVATI